MEKEHLKKCPFCGFQGYIKTVPNIDEDKEELFMTFCPNSDCPVQPSVEGETVDEVYKAWNTRTRPDPAEVERLVDNVIRLRDNGLSYKLSLDYKQLMTYLIGGE